MKILNVFLSGRIDIKSVRMLAVSDTSSFGLGGELSKVFL
jgi:hypothetical protein